MSTPAAPANDDDTATATAPRRRGRPRRTAPDSPDRERDSGGAEVVYLPITEDERTARIEGRIRTKKGRYLRPLT
ncbi:hypothetical protein V9056_10805, partial [Streptococcus agalactiae]|uniref:hypothetical protein n=1 Tax=Streptococcus agalactiae TaxID=1311 RepID=UPI0030100AED